MTLQTQRHSAIAPGWSPACSIAYTRDTWVNLTDPPSDYAAAEAKLLCQQSPDTWVVWVPDHGEIVLNKSYFYV
jgi:hypothetical protein